MVGSSQPLALLALTLVPGQGVDNAFRSSAARWLFCRANRCVQLQPATFALLWIHPCWD